jgi:hypothetical protein
MKKLLIVLILSALAAFASDATGKWSGTFLISGDGDETKTSTAYMDLKQDGTKITGTVGPNSEKQYAIKSGTIEDSAIRLQVEAEDGPTMSFDLKLDGDRITGNAKGEHDGHTMTAKLDLKREK